MVDLPKSARNRCVIELFGGVLNLCCCFSCFEHSVCMRESFPAILLLLSLWIRWHNVNQKPLRIRWFPFVQADCSRKGDLGKEDVNHSVSIYVVIWHIIW